jgi:hypothetical protein
MGGGGGEGIDLSPENYAACPLYKYRYCFDDLVGQNLELHDL